MVSSKETFLFKLIALGGTFDILHKGHKHLLREAFSIAAKVIIGVTSDRLVSNLRKSHEVRPLKERIRDIESFLVNMRVRHRAQLVVINDPYGPTIRDPSIEALLVSEETLERAFEINKIREQKGLNPLAIGVIKMIVAQNGKPISCTRIRRGEIDPEGKLSKSP